MMTFADAKPTADIEYLSSAIIHAAVTAKFKELFGRDPVEKSKDAPLVVENTVVPGLIVDSVDQDVARLLKASAVEHSKARSGDLIPPPNATLLYTMLEDTAASVALEAVPEYVGMDSAASDATLSAVNDQQNITIEEGMAHVSPDLSSIEIGVYCDNKAFAETFQLNLANSGGADINEDAKVKVFDYLYNTLPGGEALKESNARNNLLAVVGLTAALPADMRTPDAMKAPGPQPKPEQAK